MDSLVRSSVWAAKVPRQQMTLGWSAASWALRNGSQAAISSGWGVRFPGGRHLMMLQM